MPVIWQNAAGCLQFVQTLLLQLFLTNPGFQDIAQILDAKKKGKCKPAQGERDNAPAMWQITTLPSHWHKGTESPCGSGPWQTIPIRAN